MMGSRCQVGFDGINLETALGSTSYVQCPHQHKAEEPQAQCHQLWSLSDNNLGTNIMSGRERSLSSTPGEWRVLTNGIDSYLLQQRDSTRWRFAIRVQANTRFEAVY
ncbi:hypothetical protein V6N12_031799 [Hibiscus sabdariffa]|uniref:Uncharacterized protein n=1 Tax=Hibiscus sabdariffa TaxID=183260 RepID=A0ABR2A3W9_9ROSI